MSFMNEYIDPLCHKPCGLTSSGSERSMKCVINMQASFHFTSQTHPFDRPNVIMAGKAIIDCIPTKKEFSRLPTSMKYVGRCGHISDHSMLTTHPHILIAVINHTIMVFTVLIE